MTGIVNKSSTHPEENKGACIIVLRGSERAGYKKPANGRRRSEIKMPEYTVDLCSIDVNAKDKEAARAEAIKLILDSNGRDVGIDQVIRMDTEEEQ